MPDFYRRLQRLSGWSLALAILTGLAWCWLTVAAMSDDGVSWESLGIVLGHTHFGHVWTARAMLAALAGLAFLRRFPARVKGIAALGLLLSLALVGHAGASVGGQGSVHLTLDAIHLCVAAVWPAGLLPALMLCQSAGGHGLLVVLRRFSRVSFVAVVLLALSGAGESCLTLSRPSNFLTTRYGQWLLLKIVLFGGMLWFGAQNRMLVRLNREHLFSPERLRRNLSLELGLASIVIVVAAALGAAVPPR